MARDIRVKRVYDAAEDADGVRVLVDRIWPRGMAKEKLRAKWLKEAAPSTELRKRFHHDAAKWEDFKKAYFAELDAVPEAVERLLAMGEGQRLTLLYAAQDTEHNNARALMEYLTERSR